MERACAKERAVMDIPIPSDALRDASARHLPAVFHALPLVRLSVHVSARRTAMQHILFLERDAAFPRNAGNCVRAYVVCAVALDEASRVEVQAEIAQHVALAELVVIATPDAGRERIRQGARSSFHEGLRLGDLHAMDRTERSLDVYISCSSDIIRSILSPKHGEDDHDRQDDRKRNDTRPTFESATATI